MSMSLLAGADLSSRLLLPVLTDQIQASSKIVFLVGILLLVVIRTSKKFFQFASSKLKEFFFQFLLWSSRK